MYVYIYMNEKVRACALKMITYNEHHVNFPFSFSLLYFS